MIDWTTHGAAIARIVAESGNNYHAAAASVLEQLGLVIAPKSLAKQIQRIANGRTDTSTGRRLRAATAPPLPPAPLPAPTDSRMTAEEFVALIAKAIRPPSCQPSPMPVILPPVQARFDNPPGVTQSDQTPLPAPKRSMWETAASTIVKIPAPCDALCVVISDLHFPYQDQRSIELVLQRVRDAKPHTIIINGDAIDNYQLSHHDQSPARAGHTLQKELDSIRPFVAELLKHTQNLHWTMGNHEKRTWALIQDNPAMYGLRALEFGRMAELPDAVHVHPFLTKLQFADTLVFHGQITAQNVAATVWRRFQSQAIVGHAHRSSTHMNTHPITLDHAWSLAQGTLCDIPQADFVDHPPWDSGWAEIRTWTDADGRTRSRPAQRLIEGHSISIDGKTYRA